MRICEGSGAALDVSLRGRWPHWRRLLAGLGYEVILLFALLSPLVVWIRASRAMPGGLKGRLTTLGAAAYIASHYLVLVGVVIFKAATATGATPDPNYLFHVARLGFGAVATNFGTYLVAFPIRRGGVSATRHRACCSSLL